MRYLILFSILASFYIRHLHASDSIPLKNLLGYYTGVYKSGIIMNKKRCFMSFLHDGRTLEVKIYSDKKKLLQSITTNDFDPQMNVTVKENDFATFVTDDDKLAITLFKNAQDNIEMYETFIQENDKTAFCSLLERGEAASGIMCKVIEKFFSLSDLCL